MAQRRHDADALERACILKLENLLNAVMTSGTTNKERLYSVKQPLALAAAAANSQCFASPTGAPPHCRQASAHSQVRVEPPALTPQRGQGANCKESVAPGAHAWSTRHARAKGSL